VVSAGEACDITGVADYGAGDDRADTEDLGERGPARPDRRGQLLLRLAQLGIEAAQVTEELPGKLAAGLRDHAGRRDRIQDAGGLACGDFLAEASGHQFAQHRVQTAGDLVAGPGQIPVPFGPHLQHRGVVLGDHRPLRLAPTVILAELDCEAVKSRTSVQG
jgi:hypothetical protein